MDEVEGVNDIAEGFAHFSSMSIPDHRVEIHLGKGDLAQKFLPKEDHPSHPKEEDVVPSLKEVVGIEILQI